MSLNKMAADAPPLCRHCFGEMLPDGSVDMAAWRCELTSGHRGAHRVTRETSILKWRAKGQRRPGR